MPVDFNRPPACKLPDAAKWQARHGLKPYDLDPEKTAHLIDTATALDREDWSELDARKVHHVQAGMDCICTAAQGACFADVEESPVVFFDAARKVFVAFPKPGDLNPRK